MPLDLEKLIDEIEKIIKAILTEVLKSVDKLSNGLVKEIEKLVNKKFSIKNGSISKTAENAKEIARIKIELEKYTAAGLFTKELKVFEPAFKEIADKILSNYSSFASVDAKVMANLIKEQSIELVKEQFIAEGVASEVIPELGNILRASVIQGQTIPQTMTAIKELIDSGLLPNAAKRITVDGLVTFSREYVGALTKDFDSEWYLYEGPLRSTSRSFCESRAGKYWRKKEVESWASLDWQGKKPGTTKQTIFSLAGGYNCYHILFPVPEEAVPEKYKN